MKKDFDGWSKQKNDINELATRPFFREGEVWWCSMGANIGFEIDGKNEVFERPVFILKKFNNETCLILPTTSQSKSGRFYYPYLNKRKKFAINLSQVRLLDVKRLRRRAYVLSQEQRTEIKAKFISLLE